MHDDAWNLRVRGENETQRLDRNWAGLLQELRVVQTGVQVLTGFLLTLPFQARFNSLDTPLRVLYLVVVSASIAATALLVGPVAAHRILFRRHRLETLVATAHRSAIAGLALLGIALVGLTILIFDVVAGTVVGIAAGVVGALLFLGVWVGVPVRRR
ncbi:DUF6328 family protein [Nocardia thailandica]|uniref:DUF6328 family protein n=1 Tax=Nocardia thailandica TaxID=257275 RepID=A0ABW6PUG7_9NOCA|nr:DUF6328 family protein [Nocardia thailandica]